MRGIEDLRKYQFYFSDKVVELPACQLAVGMSLGKTAAVLYAIRRLIDRDEVQRVLVIAPLRVASLVWPEQILEWQFSKVLSFVVATGDASQRVKAIQTIRDITIINRENIPWLVNYFEEAKQPWPYDMIVYDESSRMKSGKKRSASGTRTEFGALCKIRKYVKKVVEMSGTNSPNGLQDLWGQIYFLDLGKRLEASKNKFMKRWFDSDYMGYNFTPKLEAEKEITEAIKDVVFGLRPGDFIELPKIIYSNHEVVLSKPLMKKYRDFQKTLYAEEYKVEAPNRAVLTGKLLQFANGSMYRNLEDGGRKLIAIHDEKLFALDSIIKENAGENILVGYSFEFDKERIRKKYPHAVVFDEEPHAYKKWKRGEIKLLLAHPASIGHGLNMQTGGNWLVWFGLPWSLELYQQMNLRLPRPGQKRECVFIRHIVAKGTVDEDVLESWKNGAETQDRINDVFQIPKSET